MSPERWTLVIDAGTLARPDGPVLVMHARGDADFTPLGQVACVQGFRPDYDRLVARGLPVSTQAEGRFATALVQITKSRAATMSAVAEALGHLLPGGRLLVDGAKDEGIEAVIRQLRRHFDLDGSYAKAHGKLAWLTRPETLPNEIGDWLAQPKRTDGGYLTSPGGFSSDGPDRGSELLVALAPQLRGRVADFGAGWGYIAGEVLAEQDGITSMDLIEADHCMLEAARHNVTDPRAAFHWADITAFTPETPYDAILCNPPFHTGRRADPSLGRTFIAAAARCLSPSGRFLMVANRHLPYEDALKGAFGTGRLIGELEGYKLYEAAKPTRRAAH